MYIFKNAFISITRNKGRNILMGIILIVIATSCAITLAIKNTASTLITSYEEKQEVTASISMDRKNMMGQMKPDNENREEMMEQFQNIPSLTIEEIETYGNSTYLKNYYYTASLGLNSDTLEKAESSMGGGMGGNRPSFGKEFQGNSSDFTITGYSSIDAMTDFIEGGYTITEGEVSRDFIANNCVINAELATLNGISVGDTITFQDEDTGRTFTFTVTGIYSDNKESANPMSLFSNSANTIITNTTAVINIKNELDTTLIVNPTFILNSKDVVEEFEQELKDKGLNEYFTLQTNLDNDNSLNTISNVASFATTFLIITLVIGIIVLFVINMINVRERKYEIGVLRTIGMKKSTLTLQFVFELLMITVVSLIIGAGIGAMMSVPVSNKLLENEIETSRNEQTMIDKNFGGGFRGEGNMGGRPTMMQPTISAFNSIDAVVDAEVLFQLFFIGIILTIVSSSASMIHIQKFSPLTILKERS